MGQKQSNTESKTDVEAQRSYQASGPPEKSQVINFRQHYYMALDLFLVTLILSIGPLLASYNTTLMAAQIIWPITWIMLFCAYVVPWILLIVAACS